MVLKSVTIWLLFYSNNIYADGLSAIEIVEKANGVEKVREWVARSTIKIISKNGFARTREGISFNKRQKNNDVSHRRFEFIGPADIKGTVVITHEKTNNDDMWIYLPGLNRVRRILSSSKKNSFVGSDFSYADVVSFKTSDYKHLKLNNEGCEKVNCFVIESKPKNKEVLKSYGYSKIVSWIGDVNFLTFKVQYYDEQTRLLKTQLISNYKKIFGYSDKWIAKYKEMTNNQNGHMSTIDISNIKVDTGIKSTKFSASRLRQIAN